MGKMEAVRLGVIGTGVMGGHHTRVAASLPGVQLVGIYDANTTAAESVATQFGVTAFPSLEALGEAVEAVIVATPTVTHAAVATQCLQAGLHVLLEKPIATSVTEAEMLVEVAEGTDRVLMIGHVERFNPAVAVARSLIDPSEVFACEFQRLSPNPGRDRTADIVLDLMIHDLDLALAFTGGDTAEIFATGHTRRGNLIDHATALLRFPHGATASLTASAVSQERVRRVRLYTASAQFTIDCASREVSIHRQGQSSYAREDGQVYLASQVEQILVPNKEPLALEQEHFAQAIRTGTTPATSAAAGLAALRLACGIQATITDQLSAGVA